MNLQWIAIGVAGGILYIVLDLVRREKLTFKYAFAWMAVCCLAILMAIFDDVLTEISHWCGFELMSNFVFFVLFGVFVLLSLLITLFLCQQNRRNDIMAQRIALLELELNRLKKDLNTK